MVNLCFIQHEVTSSMIFLVFFTLLIFAKTQSTTSTIAIQSTQQIFFEYVPYTSCPLPDNSNIVPGSINYTLLNPSLIIDSLKLIVDISFWQLVKNGIAIGANSNSFLMNGTYSQIVYYNSSVDDDYSTRSFILTSFTSQGNIQLNFANAQFYSLSNITVDITRNITTNFDENITTLVLQCLNSSKQLDIIYIGQQFFLALCPNTTTLFSFNLFFNNQTYVFNFNTSIQSITPNPSNLLPYQLRKELFWNAALLTIGGQTTQVCFFNLSNVSCHGFQQNINWLQMITSRIWGLQQRLEQQQALIIMSMFPKIRQLNFQGQIISVYRTGKTIFIQSANTQQIFLTIFDGNKLLFNSSIIGYILFYGKQDILIQAQNGSLYIASFSLPYTTITNSGQQQPYQNINLSCQGYVYNQTFDIFWTNIDYPTSKIVPLKDSNKTSYLDLYTVSLSQQFLIIGPAFEVFVMNDQSIQISTMNSPLVTVNDRLMAIVYIQFFKHMFSSLPFMLYYINQKAQFKSQLYPSGNERLIASQPCGFNDIIGLKRVGQHNLLKNNNDQLCICNVKMKDCNNFQSQEIASLLQNNSISQKQRIQILQFIHNTTIIYPTLQNDLNYQLYDFIKSGILVNIYANGVIDMVDLQGNTLTSLKSNCIYNTTNGLIYIRQFYDDFFFIICQGQNTITQYYIRENTFIFNRVVPLWGFVNRRQGAVLSGNNFIFIQVDLANSAQGSYYHQNLTSCCVLRIDPTQYTVSMISEIVKVDKILLVQTLTGVDIAYYNSTNLVQPVSFLKVYFQDSWISFRQFGRCNHSLCASSTYQYNISFFSLFYNFAASFNQQIIFDTSLASINAASSPLPQILFTPYNSTHYLSNFTFNFTNLCGPIMYFHLSYTDQNNSTYYQMATNQVVTRNKMLTQFSSMIIQIIDLGQMVPDSSFDSYIMVVQTTAINFYMKFNNLWLDLQLAVDAPLTNCLYFLYSIQNISSIKLASDCYNLNIPTQLLTLLYIPSKNSSNLTAIFGQIMLPIQLRNVKSIPKNNSYPLVFGLSQGPSKSITGILNFCQQYCNQLLITAKIGFIIDYDIEQLNNQIIVVGLDLQNISLWVNPPIPSINNTLIPSNKTIKYSALIQQQCDTISIVHLFSNTLINVILSCNQNYHQIIVDFINSQIQVVQVYKKYLNCDPVDRSKPSFTLNNNGQIDLLVVGCIQNKMTVKTQQFQTIDTSISSIITAYLQIYSPQGPQCNSILTPVRILPLAITIIVDSYVLYSQNDNLKLLYEEIDGILVDTFIIAQPSAKLSLILLSKQQIFPELQLKVVNQYYSVNFQTQSSPIKQAPSIVKTYIVMAFFILTNVFTLFTLACWFIFKRNKRDRKLLKSNFQLRQLNSNTSQSSRPAITIQSHQQDETSSVSNPINSSQVRRVTEIELFEPRYKPAS